MAKRIKITEAQVEMIKNWESTKPRKVIKITEKQYNDLFITLQEDNKLTGHPIAGDGGAEYNPQTEKENEETTKLFNEGISEDVNSVITIAEFVGEFKELIKHILTNPSQEGLSPFWVKLGVTWGDMIGVLSSMGLVTVTGVAGNQAIQLVKKNEFLKKLKIGGLKRLYNIFIENRYDMRNGGKVKSQDETVSLGDDLELSEAGDGGYPAGAEHDSNAPWNQSDYDDEQEEPEYLKPDTIVLPLVYYNPNEDGIAVFKHNEQLMVFISAYHNGEELEKYDNFPSPKRGEEAAKDEANIIENFINDMVIQGKIKPKKYVNKFYEVNYLTLMDDNVKAFCQKLYGNDARLMDLINGMSETTTTGSVGGAYVTPKIWAKSPGDMKFANKPMYKQGKIVEDEPQAPIPKRGPKPKDELARKIDMLMKVLYKNYPELKQSRINLRFVLADAFSQLALGINENLDRPGQIELDDCTKLNNNTEAQEGGCSQGAVDNVVMVKEDIYTKVANETGRTISEVKAIIEANFNK